MPSPIELDMLLKVVIAAVVGYAVGFQREMTGHFAGDRTFSLICMASALFTSLGLDVFGQQSVEAASRIAQNVLTGVGFIGGGMILKEGATIRGLTTAAGIWAMAAVGVAIGTGQYFVAILTAAMVFVVFALGRFRSHAEGPD